MQKNVLQWMEEYARRAFRSRIWHKFIQMMVCVVVFCTTYALILPALTMEQQYACGIEEHLHGETCYQTHTVTELTCTPESLGVHPHSDGCGDGSLCGYRAAVIHVHDDTCHDAGGSLICTLPELAEHTHTESCYEAGPLLCTLEELQGHAHEQACYDEAGTLICTLEELEGHAHDSACYGPGTLTCTREEILVHIHSEECLDETGSFACGLLETRAHQHSDSCLSVVSQEQILICGLEEHLHASNCNSNPEADVESREQWEAAVTQVQLTGQWADDLLAVAKTQLGYQESELNFLMENGIRKGYTRYGHWFGTTYADWDAMFVSFCLQYAGIPETALSRCAYSGQWLEQLQSLGLTDSLEARMPAAGEAVFFSGADGALYSGIISAVDTEADENGGSRIAQLRVIAGNQENRVTEITVSPDAVAVSVSMERTAMRYEMLLAAQSNEQPEMLTQTAETENYIITVSYGPELALPEGAQLRVSEYPKDSDIFRQRCQEAGYELEWLLNIGFFLEDTELEVDGLFDVVVTGKQGEALGWDITHFADDGAEQLDAIPVEAEGQPAVVFFADGFSDFGGGAAVAAQISDTPVTYAVNPMSYTLVTADPTQLQEGVDYALYILDGGEQAFLRSDLSANRVFTDKWSSPQTIGASWQVSADLLGTDIGAFTWRIVKDSSGSYRIYSPQRNQYLHVDYNGLKWVDASNTKLHQTKNASGAAFRLAHDWWQSRWSNGTNWLTYSKNNNSWSGSPLESSAATVYFARVTAEYPDTPVDPEVTEPTEPGPTEPFVPTYPHYPHAVHTGDVAVSRLRFLNLLGDGGNGVKALAGCTFRVTSDAKKADGTPAYETTIISGDSPIVQLPADIPTGSYTITEVSAADGYIRDDVPVRQFTVQELNGEKLFVTNQSIGTFINHPGGELLADKTAEVENYENRIYQVLMSATSDLRRYTMDPVDIRLVVDQSNSMLFPSGMKAVAGKTVTLGLNDGSNDDRLEALGLDKSKMHYIISDPQGTSTVWCIWHDGNTWMYQDASYYAKAKHGNVEGYRTPDEQAIFPTDASYADQPTTPTASGFSKARSNGGAINKSLVGSGLGTYIDDASNDRRSFQVYTATGQYNRLHYLEEALSYLVVELADADPRNRVSLTLFTREVKHGDCIPSTELSPNAVTEILDKVDSINTSGGTRQDIALGHVYDEDAHNPTPGYKSYTVLITDGAPVTSGDQDSLGDPYQDWNINENSDEVYPRIRGEAQKIRNNERSTLMTVALGMENVAGGAHVLEDIATDGYSYAYSDAANLINALQELIYRSFSLREEIPMQADLVDEISNSFYPVAWVDDGTGENSGRRILVHDTNRDWVLLQEGDWITLDGKFVGSEDPARAGQLLKKDDGTFYVKWKNQSITDGWSGTVYIKAKEDFIGGNAIDTNKSAYITYTDEETKEVKFPTPTVNVRLLDMNEMESEVTVYLGDLINGEGEYDTPLKSLRYFYDNTVFNKLIPDGGNVLNKITADASETDGLEAAQFYLRYAMGRDLSEEEWKTMIGSEEKPPAPVYVDYYYDNDSSHGPVGYFTFELVKQGETADYDTHTATKACEPGGDECKGAVETYTLKVTYTAYRLGQTVEENGTLKQLRPAVNVHNGSGSPGTEVGGDAAGETVQTGLGILEKENVHEVHVISGRIVITKRYDGSYTAEEDFTFTFTLHRTEDGENDAADVTKTITIPAGANAGSASITFDDLKRGTYTVTEAVNDVYALKQITVLDTTNCYSTPAIGGSATDLTFVMGNNTANVDVIGRENEEQRYTSYIDQRNGVFGEAEFTNAEIVYTDEIPVVKSWSDGAEEHTGDAVYVVLYKDEQPVLDDLGQARILRLDASNSWTGAFTVTVAHKDDSAANYNYSVREAKQAGPTCFEGWKTAVLENDGETLVYYDEGVAQDGLTAVGERAYVVQYEHGQDGVWTVTNLRAVELPMTGGMGTHPYTISGLLLTAAALVYGYSQRRKREGRGSE